MLSTSALCATVGVMLMVTPAAPAASGSELHPLHPDCLDHRQPQLCSRVVGELVDELGRFNEAFSPPDLDRLAAFYHQDAVVYGGNPPRFFVGREEIKSDLLAPLVAGVTGAAVDIAAFRFQVISPQLVVVYGSPSTVITLPNGATVTLPPLTQTHTWVRQGGDRDRPFVLLTDHNGGEELAESLGDGQGSAGPVHPDCADHRQPRLCGRVVEELARELDLFNGAFDPPDVDQLAAFYHDDAILFVDSVGRFFHGRDAIRNEFFAPLAAQIDHATVDLSAFNYRVISPYLVILYGSPTTVVTFQDGSVVTLPPLPQTLTWVRQGGDRSRPFVVVADHE